MDRVLIDMVFDIPPITRLWAIGTIILSILRKTNIIDYHKTIKYSYELCFGKKQYYRLFFSLFDYGTFDYLSILSITFSIIHLRSLERDVFATTSRYISTIFLLLLFVVPMTKYYEPLSSVGLIIQENLIYYRSKCVNEEMLQFQNVAFINMFFSIFNKLMIYRKGFKFGTIVMDFLPGHLIFFFDKAIKKLYNVDIFEPPNERLSKYIQKKKEREKEEQDRLQGRLQDPQTSNGN
ncbi:related to Degradation in the endoplasmic reticulum protein 1 [Saccharomycodes ludwigii]|uniref:Derlin n=1 Tax=Saccharomycodes ludwigii TaxID=36035 RepID=A0A376BAW3_9ASCO|nr:hypothetical protein SCDLUD_002006 [Saccharomycodes ludwigii]KAH3902191.1 hypothetical protein SCDLUD_002006 [Saccharomycodes ludwigii]SSD61290.1 related to Degradation in the endoplasmic reticulum protein 1 [Saccharomycodes ludwigii]